MQNDFQLALFLLLTLQAEGDLGVTEALLLQRANTEGWPRLTLPELQAALRALANERMAISWQPKLAALRWKIDDLGALTLRQRNLA